MDTIITLTDSQLPLFGSFLEADQVKLLNEINELRELLTKKEKLFNDNQNTLMQLGIINGYPDVVIHDVSDFIIKPSSNGNGIKATPAVILNDYKSSNSAWKKVTYILNYENKVMTGRKIIEIMYNLEPELKNATDAIRKKAEMNIFAILSNNTKEGKLIRFKSENEYEYKYGLKNWFNENGNVKEEYLQ